MKYDVITIGSSTFDVFMKSDELKVVPSEAFTVGQAICAGFGSKIEAQTIAFATGGGGTNAAVTFARQGYRTACIGVVGDDLAGKEVVRQLQADGVETAYITRHQEDHTAYSVILVGENGERTIISYKGEGQHFAVAELPFDEVEADWLYVDSIGGHLEVLDAAVRWAATHGVKLATNPGGKDLALGLDALKPHLKRFDVVMMNQEEAARLTGIPYAEERKLFVFMDDIIGGIFVMTRGRQGVVVSDGRSVYRAGVPDSPVVERTGAGDAFNSAFVAEYARSGDIARAIQVGTANASSVVTQYGAKAGILQAGDEGSWPLVEVTREDI